MVWVVWAVPGEEAVAGEGRVRQLKFLFFFYFSPSQIPRVQDGMDGRRIFRCETNMIHS